MPLHHWKALNLLYKCKTQENNKGNDIVMSYVVPLSQVSLKKSCDYPFQPIKRLHSLKSLRSCEKFGDNTQKNFPFKKQSCKTALLKSTLF